MKVIDIWINDFALKDKINAMIKENDDLGYKKNEIPKNKYSCWLAPFKFDEKMLSGFWIDREINDDTGSIDILFYIDGQCYRSPASKDNETILNQILIDRQK